jgi:hypothetical protein
MAVAGEDLILDPTSEDATNVQLDIVDNTSYFLLAHSYPQPPLDVAYASSADTEGESVANLRYQNRTIELQLRVVGTTALDLHSKLAALQQKIGKINREGGTLQRTTPSGLTVVFDLVNEATIDIPADRRFMVKFMASPVVVTLKAKPFGRGPVVQSVTDDFSTDNIAAGVYAQDAGVTGLSVSGGQLVPASTGEKRMYRQTGGVDGAGKFYDVQGTFKVTTGTVVDTQVGVLLKHFDANNWLVARWGAGVGAIEKVDGGVASTLASDGTFPAFATSTSYWVRGRIEGNLVTLEAWTSAPTATGTPAKTLTWTLAGGDVTKFGQGVKGHIGMRAIPAATSSRYDDFIIEPNTWVERTLPAVIGTAYGVSGDVPALGKLTITNIDAASVTQWSAYYGIESRYASLSASAALFWQAEALTVQGGATTTTGTGASGSGNTVVRQTSLTTRYVSCLSTQATSGGAHMSHIGTFRVLARMWVPSTNTGGVTVRFDWATGDFRSFASNDEVNLFPSTSQYSGFAATWHIVDLGTVTIPKVARGTQRWEGRIAAKSSAFGDQLDIDWLVLLPANEASGEGQALLQLATPTSLAARDEFTGIAAGTALNARVATAGGTWTTAGSATDLAAADAPGSEETMSRSATGDGITGRIATLGTTNYSDIEVGVSFQQTVTNSTAYSGVIARFVDTSNYLEAYVATVSATTATLNLYAVIGGSYLTFTGAAVPFTFSANAWYRLRLVAYANGLVRATVMDANYTVLDDYYRYISSVVTGGTLATGKPGFFDRGQAVAVTRYYDNFYASAPTSDAAIYAGRSLEVRDTTVIREDAGGSTWSTLSKYEGDYLTVPPAARENRLTRVIAKASRGDRTIIADAGIDDIQAQLTYTPRFLVVPE